MLIMTPFNQLDLVGFFLEVNKDPRVLTLVMESHKVLCSDPWFEHTTKPKFLE